MRCKPVPKVSPDYQKKFWSRVVNKGHCWEWIGDKNYLGYGRFEMDGVTYRATRISWVISHGSVPRDLWVCHKCDNPSCVKPSHLFLGTDLDNQRDALRKGRHVTQISSAWRPRGTEHYLAKFTDEDIRCIRAAVGKQRDIAKEFGTNQAQVWRIKNGKAWAHVK